MNCVVLGVDQARRSGWSVWTPRGLYVSGVAETAYHRRTAINTALHVAEVEGLPLVPVFEQHRKHRGRGVAVALGLHRILGRWLEQLELHEIKKYVIVPISTWRAYHQAPKKASKEDLIALANELTGAGTADDNEAEALLIGAWACQAKEVQAVLPKRKRRPSTGA